LCILVLLCTHKEPAGGKPRLARGVGACVLDKALLCKRAGMETRPYNHGSGKQLPYKASVIPKRSEESPPQQHNSLVGCGALDAPPLFNAPKLSTVHCQFSTVKMRAKKALIREP